MADTQSHLSGTDFALDLAREFETALGQTISLMPAKRGAAALSSTVEEAISNEAVGQLLATALGMPVGAIAQIFVGVLVKQLTPDPEAIRRIESKLDVVLEIPIRTALDVFQNLWA